MQTLENNDQSPSSDALFRDSDEDRQANETNHHDKSPPTKRTRRGIRTYDDKGDDEIKIGRDSSHGVVKATNDKSPPAKRARRVVCIDSHKSLFRTDSDSEAPAETETEKNLARFCKPAGKDSSGASESGRFKDVLTGSLATPTTPLAHQDNTRTNLKHVLEEYRASMARGEEELFQIAIDLRTSLETMESLQGYLEASKSLLHDLAPQLAHLTTRANDLSIMLGASVDPHQ